MNNLLNLLLTILFIPVILINSIYALIIVASNWSAKVIDEHNKKLN